MIGKELARPISVRLATYLSYLRAKGTFMIRNNLMPRLYGVADLISFSVPL